jgi:CCR4-NOT transcription complex subunit 9
MMNQQPSSTAQTMPSMQDPLSLNPAASVNIGDNVVTQERLFSLIMDLLIPEKKERALLELSKKRDHFPNLAPTLWTATGAMSALLQEIVGVYALLSPPAQLSSQSSNRVCNALALLQSVASHPETRNFFIQAHIPMYLYPFLNTATKSRPFEYLRLTSLGVIGALVKSDDEGVIRFLLTTEIIPLCLRIMETGTELSKTVATFILQKILLFPVGLGYICQTPDRFYAVSTVLANMVNDNPSSRLLKHIIRCYLRLSDHQRARAALKQCLPETLRDNTFQKFLHEDKTTKQWLLSLLINIGDIAPPQGYEQSVPLQGTASFE